MKMPITRMKFIPSMVVWGLVCGVALADEPSEGAALFKRQCAVCHSVVPGQTLMGPSLAGVVGRPAGSLDGFRYSRAMQDAGFVWNAEELDAFIESPRKHVRGTNMSYPGERRPEKRAAIIEYLTQLSTAD
ncbi:c-type cytochrome [Hyphomonas beringensis]|nr:cytochrome c family protein [Hyphomonas beringensis]